MNLNFLRGLVPCATSYAPHPCTVCDFFVLIQNIVNFLIYTSFALITLMAIIIAFMFMFSGGSPTKISDAKKRLGILLWGVFWVFGSWLVLNTIVNFAVNKSAFPWPWNKVECIAPANTAPMPPAAPAAGGRFPGGGGGQFGGGGAGGTAGPEGTLTEQGARDVFQTNGISVNKSACPADTRFQNVSGGCTSVGGIQATTVAEALQLKNQCHCNLEITGGTELGHSGSGVGSHSGGYKLDFALNPALNNYITGNFTDIGVRSDGAIQYKAPNGVIFAREGDHWDTTFTK